MAIIYFNFYFTFKIAETGKLSHRIEYMVFGLRTDNEAYGEDTSCLFTGKVSNIDKWLYSITCIQRPLKGSDESGLLLQVVVECKFC